MCAATNQVGTGTSTLIFYVNGEKIVETEPEPEWTLSYYLRVKLLLCGTKEACGEGGCGACTVLQSKIDKETGKIINIAVNSCLTPLCSVHGTAILTVEGIGSVRRGLHPVQERIAKSHGTQCGFCTPGFVMSMYALLRNSPQPTEEEMEDAFQGNLCRCTGYRPILAGYKTLCKKEGDEVNQGIAVGGCYRPKGNECGGGGGGCCGGKGGAGCCMNQDPDGTRREVADTLFDEREFKPYNPSEDIIFPPELQLDKQIQLTDLVFRGKNVQWYRPTTLDKLLDLKDLFPQGKLIGGNTEIGIETRFKQQQYPIFIQVSDIAPLTKIAIKNNHLKIGSAVTLSQLKKFCHLQSKKEPSGNVFQAIDEMLHWFAGQQIRNVATIAGNIITASPISDLNPVLMACRAKLNILSAKNGRRTVTMDESFFPKYRTTDLKPFEVLESIEIPLTKKNEFIWAAKQARRREDDIAIVNSCLRVEIDLASGQIQDATLTFGGMAAITKIALKTSQFLISKEWNEETLDAASGLLFEELVLPHDAPGGMAVYRQTLAQSFFMKFSNAVSSWLSSLDSGANDSIFSNQKYDPSSLTPITRGATSGVQLHQIVPNNQKVQDLIGRPVVHLAGLKHATGEAVYTDDEVPTQGQLHATLVGSPVAHGRILKVDPSKALLYPGVVAFFNAKDIKPEQNILGAFKLEEEIFATEYVHCQGQTIGMIIANDPLVSEKASKLVKIEIEELPPILTIEEAIEKNSIHSKREVKSGDVSKIFSSPDVEILEGEMRIGGQEHFYMECQCCIVTPKEDEELDVLVSVQGPDIVHRHLAHTLQMPASRIRVRCRRMGGSFGGKETKPILLAIPTALAAMKLGKSIRIVMNRWDDMVITGGRNPYLFRYKVAYTKEEGRILAIHARFYSNAGFSEDHSSPVMQKMLWAIDNAYIIPNWDVEGFICRTNLPSNTAFRGYGGPQGSIFIENIMDAVAEKVGRSTVDIRKMHLKKDSGNIGHFGNRIEDVTIRQCWEECVLTSRYYERLQEVEKFNEGSRWKKRGISVMPMKHSVGFQKGSMNQATAVVMAYTDGSIGLSHGGTEMGQGLITKMAQVATRALEGHVPLERIHWFETSTDKIPNATASCGSFSADLNGMAVKIACEKLIKGLEPIMKANPNGNWKDWVLAAYDNRINLTAVGFYEVDLGFNFNNPKDISKSPYMYTVFGVACSEVEVDCLTGDHSVLRTDIVIDVGESMNPAVDIGQIEGAFMQGYGLFTMEELLYSPRGHLLTKGPGMYKIPGMGDIPRQFNVSMLRGAPCPRAVYSSKGVGEPPLFLAASIYFAIKEAIKAKRRDSGDSTFFRLDCPATAEKIRLSCEDETVKKIRSEMDKRRGQNEKVVGWAITV